MIFRFVFTAFRVQSLDECQLLQSDFNTLSKRCSDNRLELMFPNVILRCFSINKIFWTLNIPLLSQLLAPSLKKKTLVWNVTTNITDVRVHQEVLSGFRKRKSNQSSLLPLVCPPLTEYVFQLKECRFFLRFVAYKMCRLENCVRRSV